MASLPPSRTARVLAVLGILPFVVLGLGFVLHTSLDPDVLGKWSWGYGAFLLGWWAVVVPLAWVTLRWMLRTQVFELPSGRTLTWRPAAKILLVLCIGLVVAQAARARIKRAVGVATPAQTDVFHPWLQNVPIAGKRSLGTNRLGLRGAEIPLERRPGTFRVVVFGGSTVFCAPLPLEQTPTEVMGRRLAAARPDLEIEVQNAGAEWHCSQHSLIKLLTQVRALRPDVVVVTHAINDLYRSFAPGPFSVGAYRDDYGHFLGPVAALVKDDATWAFVRMRLGFWCSDLLYDQVRVTGPEGEGVRGITSMFFPKSEEVEIRTWPSLEALRRNLDDFVLVAQQAGIQVLVTSEPYLYRPDLTPREAEVVWFARAHQQGGRRPSLASMIDGMEQFNAVGRSVAEARQVRFVDLAAAVPKDLAHFYDDVHTTARGAARVGEVLAEALAPLLPR